MAVRTGTRNRYVLNTEYSIQVDTWYDLRKAYEKACGMSCRPDESFRKVREGDVIDEEKSVRWNREEVQRLKAEYEAEVKRLNTAKNEAVNDVFARAVKLIASDMEVSEEKARILWSFLYDKYHSGGEMFDQAEEYIDLICKIKD